MWPFDVAVLQETAKKCTRKYNTRARRTIALFIESSLLCYFAVYNTVLPDRSKRVFSSPVAELFSLFGRKLKITNQKNEQLHWFCQSHLKTGTHNWQLSSDSGKVHNCTLKPKVPETKYSLSPFQSFYSVAWFWRFVKVLRRCLKYLLGETSPTSRGTPYRYPAIDKVQLVKFL